MSGEWIERKFSDLCDITRGASPRPIHEWIAPEGVPWVKISDASSAGSRFIERTGERIQSEGRLRSVVVFPGDLILSNSATPGIPMFMGIEACIHDGWLLLRNFRGLDKLFAYYLLLHERSALVQQGNGSVFTNLKTDILKNHRVRLPSMSDQRAIAHILGTLDDKIELNQRMNDTLEAMARAIFKSWFVDFDLVRAKAEGRDTGLPPNVADLFPDRFEDSELGEIPAGWRVATLKSLFPKDNECVITGPFGSNLHASDYRQEGVPLILVKHVNGGTISGEDLPRVGEHKLHELSRYRLRIGDIVFTRVGAVGRTAYVDEVSEGWLISGQLLRVRVPNWTMIHPRYLAQLYLEKSFIDMVEGFALGTTRPSLNTTLLSEFKFLMPVPEIGAKFAGLMKPLDCKIQFNGGQSRNLASLRDTLLPKLLSGEIRVKDAERIVRTAA